MLYNAERSDMTWQFHLCADSKYLWVWVIISITFIDALQCIKSDKTWHFHLCADSSRGFPTWLVYLHDILCFRYTILVRKPLKYLWVWVVISVTFIDALQCRKKRHDMTISSLCWQQNQYLWVWVIISIIFIDALHCRNKPHDIAISSLCWQQILILVGLGRHQYYFYWCFTLQKQATWHSNFISVLTANFNTCGSGSSSVLLLLMLYNAETNDIT